MTDVELMVRSSIQVFLADPTYPKPVAFGSACMLVYLDRLFFVSVRHVTDIYGLTTFLETNLPTSDGMPLIKPVGGICTFDLLKVKSATKPHELIKMIEALEKAISFDKKKKTHLDIAFAEIIPPIELLQPELDFIAFKVEAGTKLPLYMDDTVVPEQSERYGFYGKIQQSYDDNDITLKITPTLKHSLGYSHKVGDFYIFTAPDVIKSKEDYEGSSGAPILDSQGRLVALACAVMVGTKVIYGFAIQKCKELIDIALATGML